MTKQACITSEIEHMMDELETLGMGSGKELILGNESKINMRVDKDLATESEGLENAVNDSNDISPVIDHVQKITIKIVIDCIFRGEIGLSMLYVMINRGWIRYDPARGIYLCFLGPVWVVDIFNLSLDAVNNVSNLIVKLLIHPEFSLDRRLRKRIEWAISLLHSKAGMTKVRDLACVGKDGITIDPEAWDAVVRYVGAENGNINLETGELITENLHEHFLTKKVNVAYNPEASLPKVFLESLYQMLLYSSKPPEKPVLPEKPVRFEAGPFDEPEEELVAAWEAECSRLTNEYEDSLVRYEVRERQRAHEAVAYMQRVFGYALTGLCREHKIFILYGPNGRNGKTTITKVITKLLGDYAGEIRPELLLKQSNSSSSSGPNSALIDLKGKLLAVASEANQNEMFDSSVVKRLTGGDTVVGRAPYDRYETRFTPRHTLMLLTNFLPGALAEDTAFFRRLSIIRFNRSFVENPDPDNIFEAPVDKDLEDKLEAEQESILKWLVDGAVAYYRDRTLDEPTWMNDSVADLQDSRNVLVQFIEEYCYVEPSKRVLHSHFHMAFNQWLKDNSYKTWNASTIRDRLERQGYSTIKSGNRYYKGLDLEFEGRELLDRAHNGGRKFIV